MAMVRFIAVGDTHGDRIDAHAERAFFRFVDDYRPSLRIHLGDAFDFRWLRRSAGDAERWADVQADFDAGILFLSKFRPTHWLWGNHDDRLRRLVEEGSGAMRALAASWLEEIQDALRTALGAQPCIQRPYCKRRGILRLGDLAFAHGYGHGLNTLRDHAVTYGNIVIGHIHAVAEAETKRHDGARGWSAGCLCELDMDYSRGAMGTLRQDHGWAYGTIDQETGAFTCRTHRLDRTTAPPDCERRWNISAWSPTDASARATPSSSSSPPQGRAPRSLKGGCLTASPKASGPGGAGLKTTSTASAGASGDTPPSKRPRSPRRA